MIRVWPFNYGFWHITFQHYYFRNKRMPTLLFVTWWLVCLLVCNWPMLAVGNLIPVHDKCFYWPFIFFRGLDVCVLYKFSNLLIHYFHPISGFFWDVFSLFQQFYCNNCTLLFLSCFFLGFFIMKFFHNSIN